ncbi:MAG: hypothetical protein ACI4KC_05250, partial [Gemmiger sp.]
SQAVGGEFETRIPLQNGRAICERAGCTAFLLQKQPPDSGKIMRFTGISLTNGLFSAKML